MTPGSHDPRLPSEADLFGANLSNADLSEAKLKEADLSVVRNMRGATFTWTEMCTATLDNSKLKEDLIWGVSLISVEDKGTYERKNG